MKKFKCQICGYVHEESKGGDFKLFDDDYVCPICAAPKNLFEEVKEEREEKVRSSISNSSSVYEEDMLLLSNLEVSAVLSNFAKGCEKQYLNKEADLFRELSDYFNVKNENCEFEKDYLLELINSDLENNFSYAENHADKYGDRGAKRALTWSVKVTNILKVLTEKYYDDSLKNVNVYVCSICGFIYVGDNVPDVCPICKVQKNKFIEMEGE